MGTFGRSPRLHAGGTSQRDLQHLEHCFGRVVRITSLHHVGVWGKRVNGESMGHAQREKKVFHSQKFMFPSGDGVLMASMLVFSVC